MKVQQSADITRPPDEVFAFLIDQDNWAALDPTLLEVSPRGEVSLGMGGTMRRRDHGLPVTNTWEVTLLERPTRMAMRVGGAGYQLTETISLEPSTRGTLVTVLDELVPTSLLGRLFVAISGRFVRRDLEARYERLRTLLAGET